MKLFYGKKRKIEKEIEKKCLEFVSLINKDKKLKKFIKVFGITGPSARGQASFGNSDIDFYCITNSLNFFKEGYLKKKFDEYFNKIDYEISLLSFAPSILNKKDLMFFEFATSGKILYGDLKNKIFIGQIPKWEGIRLLTFKGNPFIAYLNEIDKIEYYFNKLIFGIGEAFLLLKNDYIADDFERYKRVMKNDYAKKLTGFLKFYKKAFEYRYENNKQNFEIEKLKEKGLFFLKEAWKIYLEKYFNCEYSKSVKILKLIKPSFKSKIATRLFYTINYWKYFKKLRFMFWKESFIEEIIMIQKYLNNSNETLRKKISESWKVSPRFWYKK